MDRPLESIDPREAVQMYLAKRENEVAETTYRSHKSRLKKFVQWCDRNDIDDLNNINGRTIHEYSIHLRNYSTKKTGELPSKLTVNTRLSALRVFLRFCEDIDAVNEGIADKLTLPDIEPAEKSRDEKIATKDAIYILDQLTAYRYASKQHATFLLTWRTACRLGTLHSLDVDDLDVEHHRLHVVHRPGTDTPLKNKNRGERVIALLSSTVDVLSQYVKVHRPSVVDEHGREPLFATHHGRADKGTLRSWLYQAQLPCFHSNDCPHGTNQQDCDYWKDKERMHCPSTVKPHSIRRGAITKFLGDDIPETAITDRADVSKQTMDMHYDRRTMVEKSEQRRKYFE